ncbi:MAG: winged helix-turn-helix domain-containing protein [Acidimicrobiales bacterium]
MATSPSVQLSNREARWLAIAAQGLSRPRSPARARPLDAPGPLPGPVPGAAAPARAPRQPGPAQLRRVMDQVGTIQLDAVNVLARTQFLVPFSRVGGYDVSSMHLLSRPGGPWWEYWGHAASLLPVSVHPLFRHRMERWRNDLVDSPVAQERRRAWRAAHAGYLATIRDEVAEKGPLAASQLSDPRRQSGEWWGRRSTGRRALEMLFGDGVLAAWRSPNFERVYDLAERVIPAEVLGLPTPSEEEAQRQLVALAARCLGVATLADLADYFWLRAPVARLRANELVEDGKLVKVPVEGWVRPAYMVPGLVAKAPRRPGATLLSPFDSLIWYRDRTWRLFGFHYRIEIYVPAHRRNHGYYVMPLLAGDQLVARLDLKADRKGSALLVVGAYAEPDRAAPAEEALAELHRMRQWLGLERLVVAAKGDFAPRLRAAAGRCAQSRQAPVRPSPGTGPRLPGGQRARKRSVAGSGSPSK